MKKVFLIVIGLLILCAGLLLATLFKTEKRYRYLVPEAFEGWVCVDYLVQTADTFPIEEGFELIKVSPAGMAATSAMLIKTGKGFRDEYFFYELGTGKRKNRIAEIGGGSTSGEFDQQAGKYKTLRSYTWIGNAEKNRLWFERHGVENIVCGPVGD